MTFLTFPLLLGGLIAAVVPIIIHLMMRGVPRRIEFPALRLIQPKMVAHAKKYRLHHILLLLLRIALLALLGLALARPTIKIADWFPSLVTATGRDAHGSFVSTLASSLTSQDAPVSAVIVVDTSPRMGVLHANKTSLENAQAFARWIIENLPSGSRVAVLSGRGDTDLFQVDPLAALKRLDAMTIDNAARRAIDSAHCGLGLFREAPGPPEMPNELYILSDLTLPSWETTHAPLESGASSSGASPSGESSSGESSSGESPFATLRDRETAVFIVDVATPDVNNTGIVDLVASSPVVAAGGTVGLVADVGHSGAATSSTIELFLQRSDQDASTAERRGSRLLTFESGEQRVAAPFSLSGLEVGLYHARLQLTSTDPLQIDDVRFFTLVVESPRDVLLVAGEPLRARTAYLREGLATATAAIRTTEMTWERFARTPRRDWNSRAIILLDPPPLPEKAWKELGDYATEGGGVGVFLGRAATPVTDFQTAEAVRLLGGKIVRQARAADEPLWLVPEDSDSPLLAPFQRLGITAPPWSALPVFRYWEMTDLTQSANIDLRFSDRRVAVVTQRRGRGSIVTMTTPLSDTPGDVWNLLPAGEAAWVFLVLTDGVGSFLTGGQEHEYNYTAGERVVVRPATEKLPNTVVVRLPSGTRGQGTGRSGSSEEVRVAVNGDERAIAFDETERVGAYTVRGTIAANAVYQTAFSVNVAPWQLATLARIDKAGLDALWGTGAYHLAKTPAEVEAGIVRRRVGQEMFTLVILMTMLLFGAEWLFANRKV